MYQIIRSLYEFYFIHIEPISNQIRQTSISTAISLGVDNDNQDIVKMKDEIKKLKEENNKLKHALRFYEGPLLLFNDQSFLIKKKQYNKAIFFKQL